MISIHNRLFEGIFKVAGKIRDYDISKKEWVLNGDTVMYGAAFELKAALITILIWNVSLSIPVFQRMKLLSTLLFLFYAFGRFMLLEKKILEQLLFLQSNTSVQWATKLRMTYLRKIAGILGMPLYVLIIKT